MAKEHSTFYRNIFSTNLRKDLIKLQQDNDPKTHAETNKEFIKSKKWKVLD